MVKTSITIRLAALLLCAALALEISKPITALAYDAIPDAFINSGNSDVTFNVYDGQQKNTGSRPKSTPKPTPTPAPTPTPTPEPQRMSYTNVEMLSLLNGRWQGMLHTVTTPGFYVDDPITINFISESRDMYITVKSFDERYSRSDNWWIDDGTLFFSVGSEHWGGSINVSLKDNNTLVGTYEQYGDPFDITLTKVSESPIDYGGTTQFVFEGISYEDYSNKLMSYPSFNWGAANEIPYTYELGNWDKIIATDEMFPIGYLTSGPDDIQKMMLVLDYVCDRFKHDGLSGMPDSWDSRSIQQYAQSKGGIDCRGISIIVTDILLAAGIPAKPIMCIPYLDPCEESHTVVHAYSRSLGQWIMLDPTYRLMLRNSEGQYVSLPMLRDALVNGKELIPNSNAGHNGMPFYMPYYRAYMTKNSFRFSNVTNIYSGSENAKNNVIQMLTPNNWTVPYINSRPERVTQNAASFWATPTT